MLGQIVQALMVEMVREMNIFADSGTAGIDLQSIYVTRDRVILKFEPRVQIYVAVLNIFCEIQKFGRNVVRFSKINSYEISFWLVLFNNLRNIRFLGVW